MRRQVWIPLALLIICTADPSVVAAENCRALPAGPERGACARREHPEMFGKKYIRCQQLATERGFSAGAVHNRDMTNTRKDFFKRCMQGNLQ
jgi:hypothetical protein